MMIAIKVPANISSDFDRFFISGVLTPINRDLRDRIGRR
jgi:hypothetical protein